MGYLILDKNGAGNNGAGNNGTGNNDINRKVSKNYTLVLNLPKPSTSPPKNLNMWPFLSTFPLVQECGTEMEKF